MASRPCWPARRWSRRFKTGHGSRAAFAARRVAGFVTSVAIYEIARRLMRLLDLISLVRAFASTNPTSSLAKEAVVVRNRAGQRHRPSGMVPFSSDRTIFQRDAI
jgi:hypothetical protein